MQLVYGIQHIRFGWVKQMNKPRKYHGVFIVFNTCLIGFKVLVTNPYSPETFIAVFQVKRLNSLLHLSYRHYCSITEFGLGAYFNNVFICPFAN